MSQLPRSDSQETPPTPLFDEDQTVPLEVFPRIDYDGRMWEMQLRQPNKKKITSQRFWKKVRFFRFSFRDEMFGEITDFSPQVFVRLGRQGDVPVIQLYNNREDKDPFQELQLQPCYSVSDISQCLALTHRSERPRSPTRSVFFVSRCAAVRPLW